MPEVSVVIPTYNRAAVLQEAIQSVMLQTYPDYEVIVVDDGSTDNTRDVVSAFSGKGRYVLQQNRGRSAARNHGIRLARGRYIAFLDSDDMFLPEKLGVQVSALKSGWDFGMAYSHSLAMYEPGRIAEGHLHARGRLSGWIHPEILFIQGTVITVPSVLVRARILGEVGGFDETMHICEDLDLWRRIAMRYKVLQIRLPLAVVRYRRNGQSALQERMAARTFFYEKAITEDPSLEKSIRSSLSSDMYRYYALEALIHKDGGLALHLLVLSVRSDFSQFLGSGSSYLLGFARSWCARVLGHRSRLDSTSSNCSV
jgi:glycosyltransferase involved in cell wall biosynthesis